MLFVQMLNALDDLLYQLASWILFYPLTLWKIISKPITTMRYARDQLELEPDRQYLSTVSPPIMLILTEVLSQGISLAFIGSDPILSNRKGLASLVNDNTTLFVVRLLIFAVCALALAAREVQARRVSLDRDTLQGPFYVQCYAIAPAALFIGLGSIAAGYSNPIVKTTGSVVVLASLFFYVVVEVRWFRSECGRSMARAIVDTALGLVASFLILFAAGWLLER